MWELMRIGLEMQERMIEVQSKGLDMARNMLEAADQQAFSGKAEIDVAEVHGTFEGELTARKRLVVYATGRVNGTIRYGALMVEEGGVITGNMAMHTAGPSLAKLPDAAAPAPVSEAVQEKAAELEEIRSASTFGRNQRRN